MASLSFKHLYKKYPGGVTAVSDFCLEVKDKEFIIFVGPSGCGKTTTLRMIAGLEEITEGELFIGDRLINDIAPKDRDIAMVFQNYALYPHMTVFDNMAFGLKLRKTPKEEIKRRVEDAARILDISHLLERKPKALSGGQKQRVALGRAIVREPKVFLLDEPLSNLDAKLRASMRSELTKLHQRLGTTFVYVTHDQVEAMTMATRIVVMKDGLIQQVETPQNLYDMPVNKFVAGFIGTPEMNFLGEKTKCIVEKEGGAYYITFAGNNKIKLPEDKKNIDVLADYVGHEVVAGIRPESVYEDERVQRYPDSIIAVNVEVTELMGAEIYLYLSTVIPEQANDKFAVLEDVEKLTARVPSSCRVHSGDRIKVALNPNKIHIFDKETEKCVLY